MLKQFTTGLALLISTVAFSQVGIGTTSPHASAELELGSANKALYLNRVANTAAVANPQSGMMVYDIESHCVKAYQGIFGNWSECLGGGVVGTIATLNCGSAVFAPATAIQGVAYSGTMTVPYTGGNGRGYTEQSQTVNGLTFMLPAGSFATGNGNLVYNVTGTPTASGTTAVNINNGGQSCIVNKTVNPVGAVASIDCSAALSPVAYAGTASYSGTFTVSYTGGNGYAYNAQSLTSSAAGFTATLAAGNFANGAGSVTYNVTSATVPAAGNYTFSITLGGQSCTKTITVSSPGGILPTGFALAQNRKHFIASVYDTDYLPYSAPLATATTNVMNADGTPDAVTVNYQGTLTTTGVTVQIPVTSVTGNGTVGAWSSTFVVPAMYAEDGISRTLELVWGSQGVTASSKFITATIRSVGGTFNAKKLDINAGIGNDYLGFLLGAFQYPYNNAGTITSYEVRDIPGIPDRKFGLADNTGSTTSHLMLYLPLQTADGNIWLNNNLGADYSNLNKPGFNLAQQATGLNDFMAYGSSFQWGRNSDGHELINYTSGTSGTPVNGVSTGTISTDVAPNATFLNGSGTGDWRNPQNNALWQGVNGTNNPCPYGFRIPTEAELNVERLTWSANNSTGALNSLLKFPLSNLRPPSTGSFDFPFNSGVIFSSTVNGIFCRILGFNTSAQTGDQYRATGSAVRCIKN